MTDSRDYDDFIRRLRRDQRRWRLLGCAMSAGSAAIVIGVVGLVWLVVVA